MPLSLRSMRHITWMILMVWIFAWGAGVANACLLSTPTESAQSSLSAVHHGGSIVHGHQKKPSDSGTAGCLKFCDEPRLVITKLDQTMGDGGAVMLDTLNRAMAPGAASAAAIQPRVLSHPPAHMALPIAARPHRLTI
jgi:hypothetical protein